MPPGAADAGAAGLAANGVSPGGNASGSPIWVLPLSGSAPAAAATGIAGADGATNGAATGIAGADEATTAEAAATAGASCAGAPTMPAVPARIGDATDLWFAVASFCAASTGEATERPAKRSWNSLIESKRCSLFFASARMIAPRIDSGSAAPFGETSIGFGAAVM